MIDEFKKELQSLLEKYNAYVGFSVSHYSDTYSDTYGLYDEKIIVGFDNDESIYDLAEGWGINKNDFKKEEK